MYINEYYLSLGQMMVIFIDMKGALKEEEIEDKHIYGFYIHCQLGLFLLLSQHIKKIIDLDIAYGKMIPYSY